MLIIKILREILQQDQKKVGCRKYQRQNKASFKKVAKPEGVDFGVDVSFLDSSL